MTPAPAVAVKNTKSAAAGIYNHATKKDAHLSIALNILYGAALTAASPVIGFKMLTDARWRKGFSQRFGNIPLRDSDAPCLWVHCASVGETLAAQPFITEFSNTLPNWKTAVSTITPEGNRQAKKHFDCPVFYFPIDFTFTVRRDIARLRPTAAVMIEKEIWPNFLATCRRENVPVFVINGVVSENFTRRMRTLNKFAGLGTKLLGQISMFCVQNDTYAERLLALGVAREKVRVTGNLKFDIMRESIEERILAELRDKFQITPGEKIIVGGSTHHGEEKVLLEAFGRLRAKYDNLRLILAPRHVKRVREIQALLAENGFPFAIKSNLDRQPAPPDSLKHKVIIVDTIGELASVYGLASAAFVGGSVANVGGHNVLEPAALGIPTLFGPHTESCRDSAEMLLGCDAAKLVTGTYDLETTLDFLFDNPIKTADMTLRARETVREQKGAAQRTVAALISELPVSNA